MSQDERDLQIDLRLMAYLDRQMPAEEALRLEADLAKDTTLAARLADLKTAFTGLDGLMGQFEKTAETQTPPDWTHSLAGAMQKMQELPADPNIDPAQVEGPQILAATPRGKAKIIPVAASHWTRSLAAICAVAAAALLMVFVMQEVPFLPLEPQAHPTDPYVLPADLPVKIAPELASPAQATPQEITPEQLQALGLSQAQAEQFLRDGVLLLTHDELPAWRSAGLESQLTVGDKALPTYLTADAVYNLFLLHVTDAAEAFDSAQNARWTQWLGDCRTQLQALRQPGATAATAVIPDLPAAERLDEILAVAQFLGKQDLLTQNAAESSELQRIRSGADGTDSTLLLRKVDYAWIRQHPASMARRWLSCISTATTQPEDRREMTTVIKLWWTVLQKNPELWAQYCTLAGHTRYEEAGTATALDLIDLHDDFVKICGDDPKQRFDRLMRADLSSYAKPLGFLPERTPFRNQLAQAMGVKHSFLDAVIAHPEVDRTPFVGLRQRAGTLDAYLNTLTAADALPRWNRIFSPVVKPAAAWPAQTDAWQEKSHRLLASAWIATPVRPRMALQSPAGEPRALHFAAFEPAPDFYNRLRALCAERASTLLKDSPPSAKLADLAAFLQRLTQASLDQLAGQPAGTAGIDLPGSLWPTAAFAGTPDTACRVALYIQSTEAGNTDLLMGNGAMAQVLILQRNAGAPPQIFVGAVSNPREGLAAHSADPQAAWAKLAQDGVLNGFHYNSR